VARWFAAASVRVGWQLLYGRCLGKRAQPLAHNLVDLLPLERFVGQQMIGQGSECGPQIVLIELMHRAQPSVSNQSDFKRAVK
jgi:hypothetical protein